MFRLEIPDNNKAVAGWNIFLERGPKSRKLEKTIQISQIESSDVFIAIGKAQTQLLEKETLFYSLV
jgi:hypothetical protein